MAQNPTKRFGTLQTVLQVLIAFVFVTACTQEEERAQEPVIRPAKLIEVSEATSVRVLRLPAVVAAQDTSELAFEVSGELLELQIAKGDTVERGQVLAELDQRTFQNDVASAQAQFDNAQIEFERAEQLVTQEVIARNVLDERRSTRDTAQASLDSALKRLDDTTIRAPFTGIVADIFVESFESIRAQEPILTFQSDGDREAIVQVPASFVVNIENLDPIDIGLELDAAPNVVMPSEFTEAVSVADPDTQTFEARFIFTPPEGLVVLPGMTGILTGRFETRADDGGSQQHITLPIAAIVAEAGEPFVWVVDEETMTVSRRSVEVEPGPGGSVIVNSGLESGDVVVGAGGHYLHEGAEIRRAGS